MVESSGARFKLQAFWPQSLCAFSKPEGKGGSPCCQPSRLWWEAVATTTTSLSSISWLFSTGASQWALVTPEDRQFPSRTSQLLLLSPLVHTDWLFLVYSSKPFSKLPCLWPRLQTPPSEKESDRLCWLNNRCFHFSQDEIVVFNKRPPPLFLSFYFSLFHSLLLTPLWNSSTFHTFQGLFSVTADPGSRGRGNKADYTKILQTSKPAH